MFDDFSGFPSSVSGALGAWGLVHVGYRVLVPWVARKLEADAERLKRYDADLRSEVLRLREENQDLRFQVMTLKLQIKKETPEDEA
jgi:hypothetical protein